MRGLITLILLFTVIYYVLPEADRAQLKNIFTNITQASPAAEIVHYGALNPILDNIGLAEIGSRERDRMVLRALESEFNYDELKDMADFFSSPAGRKYVSLYNEGNIRSAAKSRSSKEEYLIILRFVATAGGNKERMEKVFDDILNMAGIERVQ